jgi:hypothetical protein
MEETPNNVMEESAGCRPDGGTYSPGELRTLIATFTPLD